MRFIILAIFILCNVDAIHAQTSLKEIKLVQGDYRVGFRHYVKSDSTRTYQIKNEFNNQTIFRPIPISIWYPTASPTAKTKQLSVLDYLEILKEEEEWKNLPNTFLLDWFPYLWNTPQNKAHLTEKVNAFDSATPLKGNFPVVVYAPSNQASSIENFAMFEYLASHGFVVISSPSRGTTTRWLDGGTTKDIETQSSDVQFLLKEIQRYKNIDPKKIALMGFSFGGLSNAITAMKNKQIKAVVSLDGTERYNYTILENSSYFDLKKLNIPYVHFAQKDIPEAVLTKDKIPAELNYTFPLYDSIKYSNAYSYKFHDLTHSYFSSFGVLFANRDKRQDKSDAKIMASYRVLSQHTLHFLKAFLNDDKQAKAFIENDPAKNGFPKHLISKKMKKADEKGFNYTNFNDLAVKQNNKNLIALYQKTKKKHPDLELQEGMLNILGLRLSFDANRKEEGIEVFLLALHIYPKSANLYDSLAEAYLHQRDTENAVINFEKSLVLNPQNQNAIDKLKELKSKKRN